eukprot:SAG31_NODE_4084_length_3603_cov_5.623002_5_plen_35_part_00
MTVKRLHALTPRHLLGAFRGRKWTEWPASMCNPR